ncbi:AbrB/MazE/SpoVT family DNA-binding domain-containing protein [Candidatus Dojkabacteria bacterium]|nr:AbrB/MazE/SpoVT family DNA-binding domain-containing protein [Candidatus Dojkabacteria bacterium]
MFTQSTPSKTTVSSNYQTYVPKKVREALQVKPSERLIWIVLGDTIDVRKEKSQEELIDKTLGIGKSMYEKHGGGEKWLKKERRKSWPQ